MAKESESKVMIALKVAVGAAVLGAVVARTIRKLPHHEYVAAHADKPRPRSSDFGPDYADAPVASRAIAKAPLAAAKIAPPGAALATQAAPAAARVVEPAVAPRDWRGDCWSEIGILCHGVSDSKITRCLDNYDDALLKPCRRSMRRLRALRRAKKREPSAAGEEGDE